MSSYAFNRLGSPPVDHRSHLGDPCNIPIILLILCECSPERLPCLMECLRPLHFSLGLALRRTSILCILLYQTIPPLTTSWYTIWAKVVVIVATYRRVVTARVQCARSSELSHVAAPSLLINLRPCAFCYSMLLSQHYDP